MRRLQGSPSPESDTQATAAQAARRIPAGQAEAGQAASAEGRGLNVVKTTTHNDVDCPARPANGLNGMPTSPKSVLREFLGSAARGISLCEMTPTRSPAYHSWRERSSLRPSPPKLEWRRRGPGHPTQFRQQRRGGGELAPLAIYSDC